MAQPNWTFGDLPHVKPGEKWVAELVDESNPDGAVCIHRENGDMGGAIYMPMKMFVEMREAASWQPMPYTGVDVVKLPATLSHLKS